jgi:SHAQKYF class myb-like DNA-binding protein
MDYSNTGPNSGSSSNPADHATQTAHQIALNSASTNATLMQVYTSLTQSSTPQVPSSNNGSPDTGMHPGYPPQGAPSKYHIPPPMFHVPRDCNNNMNEQLGGGGGAHSSHHQQQQQQPNAATSQMQYHYKEEAVPPAVNIPSSIPMDATSEGLEPHASNDDSDEQSSLHSSRRKRRGGSHGGGGGGGSDAGSTGKSKKKSKQDGRWSKRFTWPEDLHRDFVSAIFDVGLKQSSPSTILEHMPKHEQITTERIKSHLQKYRLHRAKSKKEFISSYEASLRKFQNQGGAAAAGSNTISGGEVAAHLTYSNTENAADGGKDVASPASAPLSSESANHRDGLPAEIPVHGDASQMNHPPPQEQNESLMLPELTELEKQSPIGSAMGYLMGLFFSLRQQLLIQRAMEGPQEGIPGDGPMQDVYSSFATSGSGAPPAAAVTISSDYPADGLHHTQQAIPSMRTNIEENTIMKREMQNQMVLQNKMRALKEQELAKYRNIDSSSAPDDSRKNASIYAYGGGHHDEYSGRGQGGGLGESDHGVSHGQGTGELVGHDGSDNAHRPHGLSFGNSTDLWNADVVDEQLFEFLMND